MIARLLHDFNTEFETETPGGAELTRHTTRMLRKEEMTVLLGGEGPERGDDALLRARALNGKLGEADPRRRLDPLGAEEVAEQLDPVDQARPGA